MFHRGLERSRSRERERERETVGDWEIGERRTEAIGEVKGKIFSD